MKETEITLQIYTPLEETIKILKEQGYTETENFIMDDHYFTSLTNVQNKPYAEIMKNSVLLRVFLGQENKHLLIYKNKEFDNQGNVICEEKVNCPVSDIYSAEKILKLANFNNFVNLNTHIQVFNKENVGFAIQEVKDLGLFIEIEEFDYMKNMTSKEKIEELLEIAHSLNLQLGSDYNCKKVQMMINNLD